MTKFFKQVAVGALGLVALGLPGCASSRGSVDDSWLARIPESELSGVNAAQSKLQQAKDEVTKAEVAHKDAQQSYEVAGHNRDATKNRIEADQTAVKAAEGKGQQDAIRSAQSALATSEGASSKAEAELRYRKEQVDAKAASQVVTKSKEELAAAELEMAQYEALKKNNDVRARKLSEPDFRAKVADAQAKVAQAEQKVHEEEQQAQQARLDVDRMNGSGMGGSGQ